MLNILIALVSFFLQIIISTIIQLVSIFGILFLLGIALALLERMLTTIFLKNFGWKGVLITGWIGTPIHELGHAIFCYIFSHKVEEIKFFQPDPETGNLGFVKHSYSPISIYQTIGNFFIAIGPLVTGTFALLLITFILPNRADFLRIIQQHATAFENMSGFIVHIYALWLTILATLHLLFSAENINSINFWIFIYLSICIASHMAPSIGDMKSLKSGLKKIISVFFVINFITTFFQYDLTTKIFNMSEQYLAIIIALLVFAVIISAASFVVSYISLSFYSFLRKRGIFLPF